MKRIFGIGLIVLVVAGIASADWNFERDGGVFSFGLPKKMTLTSPVDTVILTDTIGILNVTKSKLYFDSLTWAASAAPSQWAKITFFDGANDDTVRYSQHASAWGPRDTLVIRGDSLAANTAATDSAIVQWYSNGTTIDTTQSPVRPYKLSALAHIVLTARVLEMNHFDSTGVKIVVRNRMGANGAWHTVWVAYLDTVEEIDTAFGGDTTGGNFIGDEWDVLTILADSLGSGTNRELVVTPELLIRGRKY